MYGAVSFFYPNESLKSALNIGLFTELGADILNVGFLFLLISII